MTSKQRPLDSTDEEPDDYVPDDWETPSEAPQPAGPWPGRIAFAIVLVWIAACLTLVAVLAVNLHTIETPDRYLAIGFGLVLLYMGGAPLVGLIWPAKPEAPVESAPIEIPPLAEVRGRTSYRDDRAMPRNVMLFIGTVFLAASLDAARHQPIVLVIAVVAAGVLVGGGVMIWRQIQYGRARLQLDAPARRGDLMRGVITTSGFGWTVAGRDFEATVELSALRRLRVGGKLRSSVVARMSVDASAVRDGNDMTFRFSTTIPVIDTSKGRFSWNVQLNTQEPEYQATFHIDVA